MFFVEQPYISDFFRSTVIDNNIPVVATKMAAELGFENQPNLISEAVAIELAGATAHPLVYMTSENAIGWIAKNLASSMLPEKIALFKDKLKFRALTESLFPEFYFKGVDIDELRNLEFSTLPLPFIIKPTVGFFSMGVYKVSNHQEWLDSINSIHAEMQQLRDLYPEAVLDTGRFIIEQYISGEEFAIDAYFDGNGESVIVGIFKHTFASEQDVSDRVYTTSKEIIEQHLEEFTSFVREIGLLADVKHFPVHIELRKGSDGQLIPIEVNPMRFGGWCTTADMTYLAYGLNPYVYYFEQKKPDWSKLLEAKAQKLFSIIVLDNSTGIDAQQIKLFDYQKLSVCFEKPLELRKINYHEYPVFGFVFVETRADNFKELEYILDSDLSEFIEA